MKSLKIPLSWQIVFMAVCAMLISYIAPSFASLVGDATFLYIRMLSLVVVPYVFLGAMSVFASQTNNGFLGRLALKNLTCFVVFEMIAVILALIISNIIFQNSTILITNFSTVTVNSSRNFGDFFLSIIPENIFDCISDCNLISIVVIFCILGFLVSKCNDKSRLFLMNFSGSTSELMQKVTDFLAAISPIGIFCVVCQMSVSTNIFNKFGDLMPMVLACSLAIVLHSFLVMPLILKSFVKCSPLRLLKSFSSVLFSSCGFSSSTLSIPFAINRMKKELGSSSKVPDVSMPIASVLSFNGTSIYLVISSMYIAQAYGINMSVFEQFVMAFAVIFMTIAANGFPLKLTVLLCPVLERMGIPIDGIGIIVTCDLFFGMVCSGVDTWSNICATMVIANSEGEFVKEESQTIL